MVDRVIQAQPVQPQPQVIYVQVPPTEGVANKTVKVVFTLGALFFGLPILLLILAMVVGQLPSLFAP